MRITYTFRHMDSSEGIKGYTEEKIARLQKYMRAPLHAEVTFSHERHLHRVDVSLTGDSHTYESHDVSEDMYASVDLAMDKVDRQVREIKGEQTASKRHTSDTVRG